MKAECNGGGGGGSYCGGPFTSHGFKIARILVWDLLKLVSQM